MATLGVVILVVLSVGASGIAVADTDSHPPTEPGADETQNPDGSSASPSDGDSTDQSGSTAAAGSSHIELTLSVGSIQTHAGGSESLKILVGATNTSSPVPSGVANIPITVEIEKPTGAVLTKNVTTGSQGTAELSISPSQNGAYEFWASSSEVADQAYGEANLGAKSVAFPGWHNAIEVGHPTTAAIAALSNGEPVGNADRQFTFNTPTGQQTKNVTTSANGIATFKYTPNEAGSYNIDPAKPGDEAYLEAGDMTAKQQFNTPWADNLYFNQTAAIFGQVKDEGAGYANQELVVSVENDGTVLTNITTTTSSNGQFLTTWTPPAEQTDFQINLYATDGKEIAVSDYEIEVSERPESTTDPSSVDISLDYRNEDWNPKLAPGESATVDVTVQDDGTPVSGAQVDLSGVIGYPGAVVTEGTVTTNANGEATYQFSIPSTAPDQTQFELRAATTVNGQQSTETSYGDVGHVAFSAGSDFRTTNGESSVTYTIEATDASTGEPISDVSSLMFLEKNGFNATIIGSESVRTNSSGVGTATLDIGSVTGEVMVATVGPFQDASSFTSDTVSTYDLTTNGLNNEYSPGEEVSFTYSTTASAPVSANVIVAAGDNDAAQAEQGLLYSEQVEEGNQIQFTIPEGLSSGLDYYVTIVASTDSGERNLVTERMEIVESTDSTNSPPSASFTVTPSSPTVGQQMTFDASQSDDSDGSIASYNWDFDGDGTTDASGMTVTHTFNTSGTYSVSLEVMDNEGATSQAHQEITVAGDNQSVVDQYDKDNNGIDSFELLQGISDYQSGDLSGIDILDLISNFQS
ncbi:PKD domain-containing protein [Halobacterium sp. KA-4]|uniref:PKD domain-containing protein n=1 Tax=Halobacterium sp. KA-4 TaxID=2896367 RepID=UPI001E48D1A3|nr:PKD domain-containing protein [Halobacterium sp. KA-4]MCD2201012.1 PKD domain-containing protein [Halobacterium sp. KA-4]